jgi:superfamily II DNA or RNA helicase
MNDDLPLANRDFNTPEISLPSTWFESRITLEQVRRCFQSAREEIRIASGFFTLKGWGLIRKSTEGKRVYLLVGIDEPGEERARAALVKEIMQDLATGLDLGRRQSVEDLVKRMERGALWVMDARALSHHGKFYIADRHSAINASANTTGRGFLDQKESGGFYGPPLIERFLDEYANSPDVVVPPDLVTALHRFVEAQVANYFNSFEKCFAVAKDITQELLDALNRWLQLAPPWDIYLKTILALEQVKPVKSSYKKLPVSYQQDMIAQSLRQIREHEGSMLVASTGLGKTVVGVHVAIQLRAEDLIDKVMVICPNAVKSTWWREMREASIFSDFFNLQVLDKKDSDKAHALEIWEEIAQTVSEHRWLLIFDESHQLRKRYSDEFRNKRYRQEDKKERRAFTRIRKLVESGNVKVLLLSGSPYATDIDNINTQLLLLPHKAKSEALIPAFVDDANAWRINDADEFINLPVASQLTTPHVAKYYGQTDTEGVYIDFSGEKKYVPNVVLHSLYIPLPFENELTPVFVDGYFDLDYPNPKYREAIETQIKTAWGSSPLALCSMLERVIDTPEGNKQFDFAKNETSKFVFSKPERREVLLPIVKKLKKLTFEQDLKLQHLVQLLEHHCKTEKVIVFCERHATAFYLEQALKKLKPSLRVFSTIVKRPFSKQLDAEYQTKKSEDIEKAIAEFAPQANNAVGKYKETYDVFVATDAYGIGVSMQDASVVVNYDIAWTPIEPVQRAGRILRFWHLPRTVQLYTFVPTLTTATDIRYELLKITQRWENLMERHGESRKLIDLPVMTANTMQEIYLPDVAQEKDVTHKIVMESGALRLDTADDKDVSSYYKHTAKLQLNRDYASLIANDIISAKTYGGKSPLLYVLLKYNDKYHVLLYDPKTETVRSPDPEKILDLIECTPDTEKPWVEADVIEELSDACLRIWCAQHNVGEQEIIRECALYLKPENEEDCVKSWLNPQDAVIRKEVK